MKAGKELEIQAPFASALGIEDVICWHPSTNNLWRGNSPSSSSRLNLPERIALGAAAFTALIAPAGAVSAKAAETDNFPSQPIIKPVKEGINSQPNFYLTELELPPSQPSPTLAPELVLLNEALKPPEVPNPHSPKPQEITPTETPLPAIGGPSPEILQKINQYVGEENKQILFYTGDGKIGILYENSQEPEKSVLWINENPQKIEEVFIPNNSAGGALVIKELKADDSMWAPENQVSWKPNGEIIRLLPPSEQTSDHDPNWRYCFVIEPNPEGANEMVLGWVWTGPLANNEPAGEIKKVEYQLVPQQEPRMRSNNNNPFLSEINYSSGKELFPLNVLIASSPGYEERREKLKPWVKKIYNIGSFYDVEQIKRDMIDLLPLIPDLKISAIATQIRGISAMNDRLKSQGYLSTISGYLQIVEDVASNWERQFGITMDERTFRILLVALVYKEAVAFSEKSYDWTPGEIAGYTARNNFLGIIRDICKNSQDFSTAEKLEKAITAYTQRLEANNWK